MFHYAIILFVFSGGDFLKGGVLTTFTAEERAIYSLISRRDGIKAKDIATDLHIPRSQVNHWLFSSALMHELCFQDHTYHWHAFIRQDTLHEGLYDFSGWYGTVSEFMKLSDHDWLSSLKEGCTRIGRNLNDTRGLFHSFADCRNTISQLINDLHQMSGMNCDSWEISFEFRLNRSRMIRIYADVLIVTRNHVFSLEFKMKNTVDPDEVIQAAKYTPYLELVFGERYEVVPALVLTSAADLFEYVPIPGTDGILPVASGDMLFNVFNEYLGFLE